MLGLSGVTVGTKGARGLNLLSLPRNPEQSVGRRSPIADATADHPLKRLSKDKLITVVTSYRVVSRGFRARVLYVALVVYDFLTSHKDRCLVCKVARQLRAVLVSELSGKRSVPAGVITRCPATSRQHVDLSKFCTARVRGSLSARRKH